MTGILYVFLIVHLLLTGNGIHLYMCEACLDLTHCMAEALPYYGLLLLGHEAFVYAVLVSPIFFNFLSRDIS